MLSHRGFRFNAPLEKVGTVFLQRRVRGNIKFRILAIGQYETSPIPPGLASGIVGFKKLFI